MQQSSEALTKIEKFMALSGSEDQEQDIKWKYGIVLQILLSDSKLHKS